MAVPETEEERLKQQAEAKQREQEAPKASAEETEKEVKGNPKMEKNIWERMEKVADAVGLNDKKTRDAVLEAAENLGKDTHSKMEALKQKQPEERTNAENVKLLAWLEYKKVVLKAVIAAELFANLPAQTLGPLAPIVEIITGWGGSKVYELLTGDAVEKPSDRHNEIAAVATQVLKWTAKEAAASAVPVVSGEMITQGMKLKELDDETRKYRKESVAAAADRVKEHASNARAEVNEIRTKPAQQEQQTRVVPPVEMTIPNMPVTVDTQRETYTATPNTLLGSVLAQSNTSRETVPVAATMSNDADQRVDDLYATGRLNAEASMPTAA